MFPGQVTEESLLVTLSHAFTAPGRMSCLKTISFCLVLVEKLNTPEDLALRFVNYIRVTVCLKAGNELSLQPSASSSPEKRTPNFLATIDES